MTMPTFSSGPAPHLANAMAATPPEPETDNRPTLQHVLRRALLTLVVVGVMVAGCLLTLLGTIALRNHAAANLQLVARSAGYTVEAAVVFRDRAAIADALALIASTEDVAEASVFARDGEMLAHWQRPERSAWKHLEERAARHLLPPPVDIALLHDGAEIGRIHMRSAGGGLLGFLLSGIVAILVCLALSAGVATTLMQRVLANILAPLHELASVARAVRIERSLGRRVSEARISEFHHLGEDMNALLSELEARQADLKRENATLEHRATHDSLTGLSNRATFEKRIARAVPAAAAIGSHVAALFLDGDRFKHINDTLGHDAGDAVLVAIATRVKAQLRERDLVARLGGDEFAVLLDGLPDAQIAHRIVANIEASMLEPIALPGGGSVVASLSIGLAVFPDEAHDAESLLRAADAAMYRTKRQRPGGSGRDADDSPPTPETEDHGNDHPEPHGAARR